MSESPKRKLIEVALPLEAINRESVREKSIRHGHPSTLHLWWARRPLAAARAVLFAQLVDDPSSNPEEFPTEAAQKIERDRLHGIIERLVVWENIQDEGLFAEAHKEILKSTNGAPPTILDPFAGGGTIPLEAQRLGLETHASDLNPVAVLINKALIEIPPKFRDKPPVFPGLSDTQATSWKAAAGLAADVRAYGEWMRDEVERQVGPLYPKATLTDGTKATVISWIWARTVICPNPVCGIEMPLVRSWWLGKKKGREAYVVPRVVADSAHSSGRRVRFDIGHKRAGEPMAIPDGTVSGRTGAICVSCGGAASVDYLRAEGSAGRGGHALIAVVAEGNRQRIYLAPDETQETAARISAPAHSVEGEIARNPRWFSPPIYGLLKFSDLFTNRQLTALTGFSDLVAVARERVLRDALSSGASAGQRLEKGGSDAEAYADAVATYLGFWIDRITNRGSVLNIWNTIGEKTEQVFARNALPMIWTYSEPNFFSRSSGNAIGQLEYLVQALTAVPANGVASVRQENATLADFNGHVLATDPPYYDNIGYSDLSDFFYVWLRRSLLQVYPELLSTLLVPKADELVANPYRHGGTDKAKHFFENGFSDVFLKARDGADARFPGTVWYAFKQSDTSEDGVASSGWETLLEGMTRGGWEITSTWPIRSERTGRMGSNGTNSLASAIVLSVRPRPHDAPTTDRRNFIAALQAELPHALKDLQHGAIAPVDLPQAAIGPGMSVFSRYSSVIESDGSAMTVRSALARINEILDQVLSAQEGDFDSSTRFALAWYRQHGYSTGLFGSADGLARARNTSVETMARDEILTSAAGKVTLLRPVDFRADYDVIADASTSAWEALHHLIRVLETAGVMAAGKFLASALSRPDDAVDVDLVKELAFLLYSVAEKNGWTKDAISFNTLATSWPEIVESSRQSASMSSQQIAFNFDQVN